MHAQLYSFTENAHLHKTAMFILNEFLTKKIYKFNRVL